MGIPSNAELKNLIESHFVAKAQDGSFKNNHPILHFGGLEQIFADNIDFHISGLPDQKISGASHFNTVASSGSLPSMHQVYDLNKPFDLKVLHVIGGDNDVRKAVVLHKTATTVKSDKDQPFSHETVIVLVFNQQGKITELRAYSDSASIGKHIAECAN
ncbi:hypothetical protein FQN57_000867 [Myotisia sp. PD_48]|nr:hypothetical protein FQN57_000867 [Myotisia sp. PD_48]